MKKVSAAKLERLRNAYTKAHAAFRKAGYLPGSESDACQAAEEVLRQAGGRRAVTSALKRAEGKKT